METPENLQKQIQELIVEHNRLCDNERLLAARKREIELAVSRMQGKIEILNQMNTEVKNGADGKAKKGD